MKPENLFFFRFMAVAKEKKGMKPLFYLTAT